MRPPSRSWLAAPCAAAVVLSAVAVEAQVASPPARTVTLRVVATSPTGAATEAVTQATIRFSEPMVALGAPDADRVPFVGITPAVPVRYRWAETNVLVVSPESGRFPFATAFEVRIAATATAVSGRRLAAPHVFRFSTPAPRLLDVAVVSVNPLLPEPGLSLRFDQPVRAADLGSRIAVAISGPSAPLPRLSPPARARMAQIDAAGLKQFDDWMAGERRRLAGHRERQPDVEHAHPGRRQPLAAERARRVTCRPSPRRDTATGGEPGRDRDCDPVRRRAAAAAEPPAPRRLGPAPVRRHRS